ncbi:hypothetical protein ACWGI8_05885 [Streptomyces sp. NPDC054841]
MPTTSTPQEKPRTPHAPAGAVLYVCAERRPSALTLAAERAEAEGRGLAETCGLTLVDVITDPYGTADPQQREGWQRVRGMAARGEITTVIVRWPSSISPRCDFRASEAAALEESGARVLFSWPPLANGSVGR